jgi:hypothetical protein
VDSHESEERLNLNKPLFEQPGTSEPRRYYPSVNARDRKWRGLEQRTMRGERQAQEREAAKKRMTNEEQLELFFQMIDSGELQRRAPDRKRQHMTDDRPGVWELGSWMEGDPPCPDELLSWEDE